MRKILVFSPYYKRHVGGLESFVEEFNINLLDSKKYSIKLITSLIPKNQLEIENQSNFEIVRLPFFELIHNFPVPKFWSIKFWTEYHSLFKENYIVVISHTRFFITSLMAYFYSRAKKVKWIHFEHGSDFVQTDNKIVKFFSYVYDLSFGKFVLSKSSGIISISRAVSKFVFILSKRRSKIIYRGFDFSRFKKIKSNKFLTGKYNGFVKIIFVGRLISGKGVKDLLMALGKLNTNKKWVCFIVGDGNCKSELVRYSNDSGIINNVIFFGQLSHKRTLEIIKSGDILINPSYTEGLPTTIIEAAVLKKPIIATNVGGTSECFYKKVSLFKAGDIDCLSQKIQSFIQIKKIDYNINKNYDYIINSFNWDKSISSFEKIII